MSEEGLEKTSNENQALPPCNDNLKKGNHDNEEAHTPNLSESLDELKCIQQELEDLKKENASHSLKKDKDKKLMEVLVKKADDDANTFEREDLIAVLTGDENGVSDSKQSASNATVVPIKPNVEVRSPDDIPEDVEIEGEGSFQIMEVVDDEDYTEPVEPVPKTLTPEEERAIAMQQMADLNSKPRGGRNKTETHTKNITLLQSLGADWNDDDQALGNEKPQKEVNFVVVKSSNDAIKKVDKPKPPLVTSVVVVPSVAKSKKADTAKTKEAKEATNQIPTAPPEVGGFKRSRVIKRKIIWDPDAPETAISYAQLARSKPSSQINSVSVASKTVAVPVAKKEPAIKKVQVNLQKEKNVSKVQSINVVRSGTPIGRSTTPSEPPPNLRAGSSTPVAMTLVTVPKKRPQTPLANGATGSKKKKAMSEIEKLMGDEGAANMLNDVKRNEIADNVSEGSPKTTGRGRLADKGPKQNAAASRKDSPTLTKPKRGAKSKASSQWDFVYNRKTADDMIIRRRSNSSYSSNASAHRTSLDSTVPTPKATVPVATNTTKTTQTKTTKAAANSTTGAVTVASVKHIKKNFEFIKPQNKNQNQQKQQPQPQTSRRSKAANNKAIKEQEKVVSSAQNSNDADSDGDNVGMERNITTEKSGSIAQIDINIKCDKTHYNFTIKSLKTLTEHITVYAKDKNVYSLIISFNYGSFWKFFELSTILNEENEKSKHKSIILEWATAVKNYLTALATFPKPLIAALHGNFFGIGVLQLALFDTILADDSTSFETHYVDLNLIPMGFSFWQNSSNINNVLFKKLFWYGERITATEAHLLGLVYKIVPSDHLTYEAHVHAEYMTSIHSIMKRNIVKERTNITNTSLQTELNAIVEKYTN